MKNWNYDSNFHRIEVMDLDVNMKDEIWIINYYLKTIMIIGKWEGFI